MMRTDPFSFWSLRFKPHLCALIALPFLITSSLSGEWLLPHNSDFEFVNQRKAVRNSCGPASLLNAFGSGSEAYHQAYLQIPGTTDNARVASVIKSFGFSPSSNLASRKRWTEDSGVNFPDLALMAQEMAQLAPSTSRIRSELHFFSTTRQQAKALSTVHKQLSKSMKRGLPPILSIRRFTWQNQTWQSVYGHFVVLVAIPEKFPRKATSFPVAFLDSEGSKVYQAEITLASPTDSALPCLQLSCPSNKIGQAFVPSGNVHTLGLTGVIGTW